jgi:hypothetical protein
VDSNRFKIKINKNKLKIMTNNTVNKSGLNQDLLKRVESIDNEFIGYNGDKYIYILDVLTSQISGNIINKFWILNEVDENTFIRIPNNSGGFIFETAQQDGTFFRDINGNPIPVYQDGEIVTTTEQVQVGVDENNEPIFETKESPVFRLNEFTRNINGFAPVLGPSILITIKRYFGEKI